MDANQQEMVAQFSGVTGADANSAQTALASANWKLEEAVALYFAAHDEPQEDDDDDNDTPVASSSAVQPAQNQSSSSAQRNPPGQRRKQMTIDDLKKMEDDGEDDDEKDERDQDMFAGGGKSGLAVQNPDQARGPTDHFKNIMRQARQNRDRPESEAEAEEPEQPQSSNFSGRAQTLGGDDAPSQVLQDPTAGTAARAQPAPRVTRTLHLWADGVSIDDGPLFRFDDPANQNMMAEINQGRAPLALLDVQPNQEVDLNLEPHKNENFVQPKKKYKPFGGSGQRLGSPTPGPSSSAPPPSTTTQQPAAAAAPSSLQPGPQEAKMEVDESAPTLQLQIRLGDGTRLQSRFNTTHTIGDVYNFVNTASPASTQRSYALMTTFPSKELQDKAQVLGEMGDFKRGGVVVQKWT